MGPTWPLAAIAIRLMERLWREIQGRLGLKKNIIEAQLKRFLRNGCPGQEVRING